MALFFKRISLLSFLIALFHLVSASLAVNHTNAAPTPGELILGVTVSGLSDKLVLELNEQEELQLSGDQHLTFKTIFTPNQSYSVKIKQPAPNHVCKLKNAQGLFDAASNEDIVVTCQKTGSWNHPGSLADNISLDGQNAATPVVAMDDDGNGVVVWSQYDGGFRRIFKSEYQKNKWSNPATLKEAISPENSDAVNPQVAMAGNGEMVIVWEQIVDSKIKSILMAEKRNGKWQTPKSVMEPVSGKGIFAWQADVAMDDAGNTVIAWSQELTSRSYAIYKSEYRKGSWSHPASPEDAISPEGRIAIYPRVAMNNKGMTVITWNQDPNRTDNIYKSVYLGGVWKHPADATDFVSPWEKRKSAYNPVPFLSDSGSGIITWQQTHKDRVRIYKSEFDGRTWKKPLFADAISPMTAVNYNSAINTVAMDSKGNAIILWSMQKIFNQALYLSNFKGGKWQHPGENDYLAGSKKDRHFNIVAKVAMSDSGKSVIAWQQQGEDRISRVFMTEFDNGVWHLPGKQLSIGDNPARNVRIASAKNGDFIVVWQQNDGKFDQIYKSEFHLLKK